MFMLYFKNKITGETKSIETGFNWKVFLFGWIYLLIVGDYVKSIILLIFGMFVWGCILNSSEPLFSLLCAVIGLIVHVCAAWDYHKEHQTILEKRDYELMQL